MKKHILFFVALVWSVLSSQAQVANRNFSQGVKTFQPLSNPNTVVYVNDSFSVDIPIGFSFQFNGQNFDTVRWTPFGYVFFGPAASHELTYTPVTQGYFNGPVTGVAAAFGTHLTYPFYANFGRDRWHYKVIGSAPNRKLVMEWLHVTRVYPILYSVEDDLNFQIILEEGTNAIEFHYGEMIPATSAFGWYEDTLQVGLRGVTHLDRNMRTGTWSQSIAATNIGDRMIFNDSTHRAIPNGTFFRFGPTSNPAPAIRVINPAENSVYDPRQDILISYQATQVQSVDIYFRYNNGPWQQIADNHSSANGTFLWNPPNYLNTVMAEIKVKNANSALADSTNGYFSILNPAVSLQISRPNQGETFFQGDVETITWTSTDVDSIDIYYSLDSQNWIPIASRVPAAQGSYAWTVPSVSSTTVHIRLVSSMSLLERTDRPFQIRSQPNPSLRLITPNGGERFEISSQDTIAWDSDLITTLDLYYSLDGGQHYTSIAQNVDATTGHYIWNIPNTPSTRVKVRLTGGGLQDESDHLFEIYQNIPVLELLSPNGGERLLVGTQHRITWNSNFIQTVDIEYSINGGQNYNGIIQGINAATGEYLWMVPANISDQVKVRVTGGGLQDESDSVLEIFQNSPVLNILSPNGGEVWYASSKDTIRWQASNVGPLDLYVSFDGAVSFASVAQNLDPADSFYVWSVPDTMSTRALMLISSAQVADTSDAPFEIIRLVNSAQAPAEISSTVYPNPTVDELHLHSNGLIGKWSLLSLEGKRVLSGTETGSNLKLDLKSLPAGTYILATESAGKYKIQKH